MINAFSSLENILKEALEIEKSMCHKGMAIFDPDLVSKEALLTLLEDK